MDKVYLVYEGWGNDGDDSGCYEDFDDVVAVYSSLDLAKEHLNKIIGSWKKNLPEDRKLRIDNDNEIPPWRKDACLSVTYFHDASTYYEDVYCFIRECDLLNEVKLEES